LKLRPLQEKVVNFINDKKNEGLLVVHSTGCGKTLTAVTASQCFLDNDPDNRVVLVAPTSLIGNFKKELRAYGVPPLSFEKYSFYTYNDFMRLNKLEKPFNFCENTMLIIDEAHNLRNYRYGKRKDGKKFSDRYVSSLKCARFASKRLLLTATPFINKITDFIPLINILYGDDIVGNKRDVDEGISLDNISNQLDEKNIGVLKKYLNGKVDFVNCKSDEEFPELKEHYKVIKMNRAYLNKYMKLLESEEVEGLSFGDPYPFYNAQRRIVNKVGPEYYSLKLDSVLTQLQTGKSLIYTNWLDFGADIASTFLTNHGISHKIFSGKLTKKARDMIVKDFNNDKFEVLIVTRAGGEGLDLKGIKSVIVMEPVWNDAVLRQIIGRAVRYKSHHHLPKKDRVVNVWKMILVEPDVKDWRVDPTISGDALLYRIIEKKATSNEQIVELLKLLSIK
jgi:SNF2 family DNA or RNA helicase